VTYNPQHFGGGGPLFQFFIALARALIELLL
jgi:hypothetical protein